MKLTFKLALTLALALLLMPLAPQAADYRGAQFVSLNDFKSLERNGDTYATKPIAPEIPWNELVVSWNMNADAGQGLQIEIQYESGTDAKIPALRLATWRAGTNRFSEPVSASRPAQTAYIDTDTFKLPSPQRGGARLLLTFLDGARPGDLKFIGLSFRDSTAKPAPLAPNQRAWGKTVDVASRSQLDYPEGAKIWCSPTSTSMILDYWSRKLNRPELSLAVPEVARSVHDVIYKGAGNWPFNTAFAGSFKGMRGYVTRLTDISELEDWIEAGIPVATSVSYNRLKGRNTSGSGHLIVCVGFAENGDIIVNDPGTQLGNVRRNFSRDLFRQAWADSGNTVYIIYPENAALPAARFAHWETRAN
jgi:hypothetical protein